MGEQLSGPDEDKLNGVLKDNIDVFIWTTTNMPGVNPRVAFHKQSIYKDARPVTQKKRKIGEERMIAAEIEVEKLLKSNFIRKVHYTTWLTNVVLVKKSNKKWKMCLDYTDSNKACPKDAYPLPSIDHLVDRAFGHHILSFLDAYSGYNQIPMYHINSEKIAFITNFVNNCYNIMPFGLKNARTTCQRLMNRIFWDQIGRNVEVYVDDMVVKSNNVE